jgi:hypothetical protein
MKRCAPTLLALGGTYANNVEMQLENVLPFAFPFGIGGPKMNRRVKVSLETMYPTVFPTIIESIYGGAYHLSNESYLQQTNVIHEWGNDMQVKC